MTDNETTTPKAGESAEAPSREPEILAAIAAEREACAQIADENAGHAHGEIWVALKIAESIRSRGDKS